MKKLLGPDFGRLFPSHLFSIVVLVAALAAAAQPAQAQQGAGIRGGVSADPDQFYLGAHYVTGPIVDRLRFQPNFEIGFGDDLTLVAANFEFGYWTRLNRDWQIYFGGGPALNVYDWDHREDSDAEPGFNMLVGFRERKGLFFEFKIGVLDSPDVKLGVGYTF